MKQEQGGHGRGGGGSRVRKGVVGATRLGQGTFAGEAGGEGGRGREHGRGAT